MKEPFLAAAGNICLWHPPFRRAVTEPLRAFSPPFEVEVVDVNLCAVAYKMIKTCEPECA